MSDYIKKSDLEAFNHQFMLKVDVDSIYFGYKSLGSLMEGFGVSVKAFVDSKKSRLDSSSSSRFGLSLKNNGEEKVMINVNGINPDKIRLDFIPNIKIMECQVNDISPRFYINMYFVGTGKTRPTTYFTNMELKAITALLNQAREYTLNDLKSNLMMPQLEEAEKKSTQLEFESFSDMCLFESITGGSQDRSIKNKQTCLSQDLAKNFGSSFDLALENFANCNQDEFNKIFSKSSYVGSTVPSCSSALRKELSDMRTFVKNLSKGVFFCASCAGCKLDFNRKENSQKMMEFDSSDEVSTRRSLNRFYSACDELQAVALRNLKFFLFQNRDTMLIQEPQATLPFLYNIDVGVEISPLAVGQSFFLRGKEARDAAKSMLKERWMMDNDGRVTRMENHQREIQEEGAGPVEITGRVEELDENPHVMSMNFVPTLEDNDLLEMGFQLAMSEGDVFHYGTNQEEVVPSSVAGGKVLNALKLDVSQLLINFLKTYWNTENDQIDLELNDTQDAEVMGIRENNLNYNHHLTDSNENQYNNTDYIYNEDSIENSEDAPVSTVSLYNQLDTRGEIGGVHTGRVLLKTFKDNEGSGSMVIENFNSNRLITGLSLYNPKIKHNGMVRKLFLKDH